MAQTTITRESESIPESMLPEPSPQEGQHQAGRGRGWHGDPEGHAGAGRVGGAKIAQDRAHMAEIGRRGGSKVAEDRAHMAEIGRLGGSKLAQNRAALTHRREHSGQNT